MRPGAWPYSLLLALCAPGLAAPAQSWPELPTPAGAQVQYIAEDMVLNGNPSRVRRLSLKGHASELSSFYRQLFKSALVENQVRGSTVIASRQGDYFHTVQIVDTAFDTAQATLMTTLLKPEANPGSMANDTKRLLPVGSVILSTIVSNDSGRRSLMLVAMNHVALAANHEHLVAALSERGFELLSQDAAEVGFTRGVTLYLSSTKEAATVTIADIGTHRTLVINRTKEPR